MQRPVQAPVKQDDSRLGLFDLPPEIRDMIYSECLTSIKPLKVWRGCIEAQKHPGQYFRDPSVSHFKLAYNADVLRQNLCRLRLVCTTVKHEADKIFFGDNHFDLTDLAIPRKFLEQIGSGIEHLRRLSLGDSYVQQEGKKALDTLRVKRATKLQKLVLGYGTRQQNFRTPRSMAKAVMPLLRMLRGARRGTNETPARDVLEVRELAANQIEVLRQKRPWKVKKWQKFGKEVMDIVRNEI